MEIFKEIPQFSDYLVSNYGRVKTKARSLRYTHSVTGEDHFRLTTERFLKEHYNNLTGYKFYQLYLNKKMYNKPVHQLVAPAFIANPNNYEVINHIDGNKHNNVVENLEWCTNEYNHEHATKTGLVAKGTRVASSVLNDKCIIAIRKLIEIGWSHGDIAKLFEVSRGNISQISAGTTWKHVKTTGEELNYQP